MLLPAFLPEHLQRYENAETEDLLFSQLSQNPVNLIHFFEFACDDETWCEEHEHFIRLALDWFVAEFFNERLSQQSADIIIKTIHKHVRTLNHLIPYDLEASVEEVKIPINSLLFSGSSSYFHELIRINCHEKKRHRLKILNIPLDAFRDMEELVRTGSVDLWKLQKEDLFELLKLGQKVELQPLVSLCQETLKRYINGNNVIKWLIEAYLQNWTEFARYCCAYVNEQSWGIGLYLLELPYEMKEFAVKKPLACEFLQFTEAAKDVFTELKPYITHIICGGFLPEQMVFRELVKNTPNLISLDISRSRAYNELLSEVIPNLRALDVSQCQWLSNQSLTKIVSSLPHLIRFSLSSNTQISYPGWAAIHNLRDLEALDVSRCLQINDQEFSLIIRASPGLSDLRLAECTKLGEKSFLELARGQSKLIHLDVSRTHLSDAALMELVTRCTLLRVLDLTRCLEISERGLFQSLRQAKSLKELKIRYCRISEKVMEQIYQTWPLLKIEF